MFSPSRSLRRLLETELDTFEKLEIALLLFRSDRPLSVEELAVQLQVGHEVLGRVAADLARTGIVMLDQARGVVTLQTDDATRRDLAEAAQLFEQDRPGMFQLMTRVAMDRLRSMSARTFADAFQLRKKKGDA